MTQVRLKLEAELTTEEREWVSIDKVVNPDVWEAIVGRMKNADAAG